MQCLFKQVVTPQQRLICAAAGFGLSGVGAWSAYKAYQKRDVAFSYIEPWVNKMDEAIKVDPAVYHSINLDVVGERLLQVLFLGTAVTGGRFTIQMMHTNTVKWMHDIRCATQCCPIIRRSALYSLGMVPLGAILAACGGLGYFCVQEMIYSNKRIVDPIWYIEQ